MNRIEGTSARPLVQGSLIGDTIADRRATSGRMARPMPSLRLLQKDVYAELTRRRRRAQIAARRWVAEN